MTPKTRSGNSIANISSGIIGKTLLFFAAFSVRTAFIRVLGAEYAGINGLLANLLGILTLSDLGIEEVFLYFLYNAIKQNEEEKLSAIINYFKRTYIAIGSIFFVIGCSLIPILPLIVNSGILMNRVIVYYILCLLNTCASYFFSYRILVLKADQKQIYDNIVTTALQILLYIIQFVCIVKWKSYVGFLILQLMFTIIRNIVLTVISTKKYPFIRTKIDNSDYVWVIKEQMLKKIKSTFIYRAGTILIHYSDNILISMLLGTATVGLYSNYMLLFGYADAYIYIVTTGVVASIGNLNAEGERNQSFKVFRELLFLYFVIATIVVNIAAVCIQPVIPIWIGDAFLLDDKTLFSILLLQYFNILSTPAVKFRETLGKFEEVRGITVLAVVLNVVLSFTLGQDIGISGIILATVISKGLTLYWYEPMIVYKKWFLQHSSSYYICLIRYVAVTGICLVLNITICSFIPEHIAGIIGRGAVSLIITTAIIAITYHNSPAFNGLTQRGKWLIKQRR